MVTLLEEPRQRLLVCAGRPLEVLDGERRLFRFTGCLFRIDACGDEPWCFRVYNVDGAYPPEWVLARAVTVRTHTNDDTPTAHHTAWAAGGGEFTEDDLFVAVGRALASVL